MTCLQEEILSVLPTVGFVNVPGHPSDGGGDTIAGNGAVILTETKMILFCSRGNRGGSASDSIEGTTRCFCCPGFCGVCVCENKEKAAGRAQEGPPPKAQRHAMECARMPATRHAEDASCIALMTPACVQAASSAVVRQSSRMGKWPRARTRTSSMSSCLQPPPCPSKTSP